MCIISIHIMWSITPIKLNLRGSVVDEIVYRHDLNTAVCAPDWPLQFESLQLLVGLQSEWALCRTVTEVQHQILVALRAHISAVLVCKCGHSRRSIKFRLNPGADAATGLTRTVGCPACARVVVECAPRRACCVASAHVE